MQRRTITMLGLPTYLLSACSNAMSLTPKPSYGVVIRGEPASGATPKLGVRAISNDGKHLFSFAELNKQADNSSYEGIGIPEWVQITWRKDTAPGKYWTTGQIIGDYKVEVASRIPADVSQYASQSKGRAIRLIFRIRDDSVLLAWDVQEVSANGQGWSFSRHGGDF